MKNPHALAVRYGLATLALIFGLLTIMSGGKVIFGSDEARVAAGAFMPFIVWFNFVAGFVYVAAAASIATRQSWAGSFALFIAAITGVVFLIFIVLALTGYPYETRTVGAMTIRTVFWLAIGWFVQRRL